MDNKTNHKIPKKNLFIINRIFDDCYSSPQNSKSIANSNLHSEFEDFCNSNHNNLSTDTNENNYKNLNNKNNFPSTTLKEQINLEEEKDSQKIKEKPEDILETIKEKSISNREEFINNFDPINLLKNNTKPKVCKSKEDQFEKKNNTNNKKIMVKMNLPDDIKFKGRYPEIFKEIGYKGKHDKTRIDNSTETELHLCKNNLFEFINNYSNSTKNYIIFQELHIEQYIKSGNLDYSTLFNTKIKVIYYETIPKHMKNYETEEEKKRQEELIKENNRIRIKHLILRERINRNIEKKILDKIFNESTFSDMLIAYLLNRKYIKLNGQDIPIKGFKTFKHSLTDDNKILKERIKNKLIEILKKEKKEISLEE